MNNQPRLIDADKLLEWMKKACEENSQEPYEIGKKHMATMIENLIKNGYFNSDPIPLPTIKPGDSVWHERFKAKGIVERISKSGKKAYVRWERGMPSYVDFKSLEVVSHD